MEREEINKNIGKALSILNIRGGIEGVESQTAVGIVSYPNDFYRFVKKYSDSLFRKYNSLFNHPKIHQSEVSKNLFKKVRGRI